MDAQVLTRWLTDLRSNEFTQTKSNLRDDSGFCCLGVLVNRFADEWIGDHVRMAPKRCGLHLSTSTDESLNCLSGFLNDKFMIEIGLDPRLASDGMHMNDRQVPFPVIADYIEEWHARKANGEDVASVMDPDTFKPKIPAGWNEVEA